MHLKTETLSNDLKILIISKEKYSFVDSIKNFFENYQVKIFYSSEIPRLLNIYDYIFIINFSLKEVRKILKNEKLLLAKRIVLIYVNKKTIANIIASEYKENKKIKIVALTDENLNNKDLENILWFGLISEGENYLKIKNFNNLNKKKKEKDIENKLKSFIFKKLSFKKLIFLFLFSAFVFHLIFLPLLLFSFFINYQIMLSFKSENLDQVKKKIALNNFFIKSTEFLYKKTRPTYLFLSLAIVPDNLIDLTKASNQIFEKSFNSYYNAKAIFELFLKNNKNEEEKKNLLLRLEVLNKDLEEIDKKLDLIIEKFPKNIFEKQRQELIILSDYLDKARSLLKHRDYFFFENGEKKILLLFANNRELRPGGGFIGSFGVITLGNLSLKKIDIYDVYDADGQLKIHVEPPLPIKQYLHQPHWYLRDSNFSPDFYENYEKAKFFLREELGWNNFDGAILITTSAVEEILKAYGKIYLPDFKEEINSDNFFIKAQMYSEKNFFPGSIQKKSFLSSLMRQLLINSDQISYKKLIKALKKGLDEKKIVVYFEDQNLQSTVDKFFYSGRIIKPKCSYLTSDCTSDYLFFYDANLGVNKANFYVSKQAIVYLKIDEEGKIKQTLSLDYQNDSPSLVFPGGIYRDYFQILLPKSAQLKEITKDGVLIENFDLDESDNYFKRVGFYFELPPQKRTVIKINYWLTQSFKKGRNIYQLIVQKQIGSENSDLILNLSLAKNINLVNQNFNPLVNDNNIVYNTILDSDKIFFMEFIKN